MAEVKSEEKDLIKYFEKKSEKEKLLVCVIEHFTHKIDKDLVAI